MLFDSTVRRELARGFGATLVVILTIVLTMFLIRTVGQAADGAVAPQDVVLLLGYVALGHLPTMMALSLFVAVVITLGRMYRDSEMAIWFASGVGLTVLPSSAADGLERSNPLLAVKPFAEAEPSRRVVLAWRASFPRHQAIDALIQAIQACALPGVTPV